MEWLDQRKDGLGGASLDMTFHLFSGVASCTLLAIGIIHIVHFIFSLVSEKTATIESFADATRARFGQMWERTWSIEEHCNND